MVSARVSAVSAPLSFGVPILSPPSKVMQAITAESVGVNYAANGHSPQYESISTGRRVRQFCGGCRAVESFHGDDQQAPHASREASGRPPAQSQQPQLEPY